MRIPNPAYLLILNDYQRNNLVWLLQACGMPARKHVIEPFDRANTGDWLGEIYWMLEGDHNPVPSANTTHEELRELVYNWTKEPQTEKLLEASKALHRLAAELGFPDEGPDENVDRAITRFRQLEEALKDLRQLAKNHATGSSSALTSQMYRIADKALK